MDKRASKTILGAILKGRCPACRKGQYFETRNPFKLKKLGEYHKNCPSCGQRFSLEPGFYFGAAYISYGLNVVIWIVSAVAVYNLIEEPEAGDYIKLILLLTVLFFPIIFRASRIIWATIFIPFGGEKKQFNKPK
jgi:uncharacterized protein (DUF983 family)